MEFLLDLNRKTASRKYRFVCYIGRLTQNTIGNDVCDSVTSAKVDKVRIVTGGSKEVSSVLICTTGKETDRLSIYIFIQFTKYDSCYIAFQ